jgi:hypothetical protein
MTASPSRAARRIQRRVFLRALGLGMAVPAALRVADTAVAAAAARPKRFMLFFMPHGVPPEHFFPKLVGGSTTNFSLADSGVSILGPLEPYKQHVNVLEGFQYPGAMTHEGIVSFLSNTTTFSGGSTVDETTPRTTVEHVIANGLGTRPLVLGACAHRVWGLDKDGKLMWDGQPVVPEKSPVRAYDTAFAGIGGPTEPDPNVALRDALHTLTEGELQSLQGELTGLTSEQSKLATHLEAIRALKAGGGGGTASCTTAPVLPAVEAVRQASMGQPDDWFLSEPNFPAILKAQLAIAGQALRCNAAQVVAVQPMYANCDLDFSFMGAPGSHHNGLSHTQPQQNGDGSMNMATRDAFARAQRWFIEQLVENVVAVLDQEDPADPAHKVIDNTIIYFCSEIGEGAWHTTSTRVIQVGPVPGATAYMPIVTIGGGGGALKTGQTLTFEGNPPAGNVYLSLSRAMGVSVPGFGDATTPVQEILA